MSDKTKQIEEMQKQLKMRPLVEIKNPRRISDHCVSSEDIKKDTKSDFLTFIQAQGFSVWLMHKGIDDEGNPCTGMHGYIEFDTTYLGDDIIINHFIIHDDPKLAEELTNKYKGKILIFSALDNLQ